MEDFFFDVLALDILHPLYVFHCDPGLHVIWGWHPKNEGAKEHHKEVYRAQNYEGSWYPFRFDTIIGIVRSN